MSFNADYVGQRRQAVIDLLDLIRNAHGLLALPVDTQRAMWDEVLECSGRVRWFFQSEPTTPNDPQRLKLLEDIASAAAYARQGWVDYDEDDEIPAERQRRVYRLLDQLPPNDSSGTP